MAESKLEAQPIQSKFSQKDFNMLNTYATKYLWFFVIVGLISVALSAFGLPSSVFSLCYNVLFTLTAILALSTTRLFNKLSYYVNLTLLFSILISVFVLCVRFGNIFFSASDDIMGLIGDKAFVSSVLIIVLGILIVLVAVAGCVFAIYYLVVFISNRKAFIKK